MSVQTLIPNHVFKYTVSEYEQLFRLSSSIEYLELPYAIFARDNIAKKFPSLKYLVILKGTHKICAKRLPSSLIVLKAINVIFKATDLPSTLQGISIGMLEMNRQFDFSHVEIFKAKMTLAYVQTNPPLHYVSDISNVYQMHDLLRHYGICHYPLPAVSYHSFWLYLKDKNEQGYFTFVDLKSTYHEQLILFIMQYDALLPCIRYDQILFLKLKCVRTFQHIRLPGNLRTLKAFYFNDTLPSLPASLTYISFIKYNQPVNQLWPPQLDFLRLGSYTYYLPEIPSSLKVLVLDVYNLPFHYDLPSTLELLHLRSFTHQLHQRFDANTRIVLNTTSYVPFKDLLR